MTTLIYHNGVLSADTLVMHRGLGKIYRQKIYRNAAKTMVLGFVSNNYTSSVYHDVMQQFSDAFRLLGYQQESYDIPAIKELFKNIVETYDSFILMTHYITFIVSGRNMAHGHHPGMSGGYMRNPSIREATPDISEEDNFTLSISIVDNASDECYLEGSGSDFVPALLKLNMPLDKLYRAISRCDEYTSEEYFSYNSSDLESSFLEVSEAMVLASKRTSRHYESASSTRKLNPGIYFDAKKVMIVKCKSLHSFITERGLALTVTPGELLNNYQSSAETIDPRGNTAGIIIRPDGIIEWYIKTINDGFNGSVSAVQKASLIVNEKQKDFWQAITLTPNSLFANPPIEMINNRDLLDKDWTDCLIKLGYVTEGKYAVFDLIDLCVDIRTAMEEKGFTFKPDTLTEVKEMLSGNHFDL